MIGWLQGDLTTLALCWRIERRDGVALGFTSHDRDLLHDGLLYRAAPGMTPSAVSLTDGFEVDTLEIAGALTHDAIREEDLAAGRWDGATVRLFAIDWSDPAAEIVPLMRGELGESNVRDGAFTAELAGPTAVLARPVVEETSPDCRANLGDERCRIDMADRVRLARVTGWDGQALTIDVAEPVANAYGSGRLRWIGGTNSGLSSLIALSEGNRLVLRDDPPAVPVVGTLVEISEGCDRTIATCAERFNNAANFRGEPYLPGVDLLTRYPGA
ncbi:DUF2163 domain-containing protein [uncultured Sphingomonas sp.]|uniref:DUF2163 domain-containing protein n=1 Tax=uncultured Sphingomonas sp. TaxID=158754 RepID=UPI0025E26254|nr:DUF2163 domain-containing protein [uncultured Sphingomonas sp.]